MKITIEITPETLGKIDPHLVRTNRDLRNWVQTLVIAAVNTNGSSLDLDRIGRVVAITKTN